MRPLSYTRATDVDSAIATVRDRPDSAFLAGGTTEVDLVRQNVLRPGLLVDINDLPLNRVEDLPDGGLRIGALARMSDVAQAPGGSAAVPRHLPGAAAGRLGAAAEHGLDGRQPVPARAVQLLPRRDVAVQQARSRQRLCGPGWRSTAGTPSSAPATGASPLILRTWRSRWSPWTPSCTRAGHGGDRAIPIDDFFLLPGDTPEREHPLEHGELIVAIEVPAAPVARQFALPEVPRPRVVRVRPGIGRGRGAHRGRCRRRCPPGARRRRRPSRGGRDAPSRACSASRPTAASFAEAAGQELAAATPRPLNAFKVELAQRAIVRALASLTNGDAR